LNGQEFESIDRAFITDIVYGTLKWQYTIDYLIEKFRQSKLKRFLRDIQYFEDGYLPVDYTDKIPFFAACNESVKLAAKYGHAASSKYVNAVLRNIARNKENLPYPTETMIRHTIFL